MSILNPKYQRLRRLFLESIPSSRIFDDALRTLAYGTDASFYRLIPKLVVRALTPQEVSWIMRCCHNEKVAFTFRAAGTSLSGQALSDSVLILINSGWKNLEILEQGYLIRVGPGVTGGEANRALKPFGRRIGPDPASIDSAMMGGIAANNASGMCCGVAQNTYHTLKSLKVILADGTCLDTARTEDRELFRNKHPAAADLEELSRGLRLHPALVEKIRHKYRIKNTLGYRLNALLDYEHPADILSHLLVGSEGTLGFIEELTLQTVPEPFCKATALILFSDLEKACKAAQRLAGLPLAAVELMDFSSLEATQGALRAAMPCELRAGMAALLMESGAPSKIELDRQILLIQNALSLALAGNSFFTQDPAEIQRLWKVRKELFPAVGGVRPAGQTVVIEDICFPLENLARGARDLRCLLDRHGYEGSVIFGHALSGNLHFVFTQDFGVEKEVLRYASFLEELTELVAVKFEGSLKAEHGTGRNMAPFVEKEWGRDAYVLMQRIKTILDPEGLLNPGVILNADRQAHLKNLKPLPPADPLIDACTECGFCERVCPSRELTLTPRQRITVYREMVSLTLSGRDRSRRRELEKAFRFQGDESCAADGVCAVACPLEIDTGQFIKKLRERRMSKLKTRFGLWAAKHFQGTLNIVRLLLKTADVAARVVGVERLEVLTAAVNKISGGRIPRWIHELPAAGRFKAPKHLRGLKPIVYFPSCLARTFSGAAEGLRRPLVESAQRLLEKSGHHVLYPEAVDQLCCGLAFESKGFGAAAQWKLKELHAALQKARGASAAIVFTDTSPCAQRLKRACGSGPRVVDPAEWIVENTSLFEGAIQRCESVALHIPCSAQKQGLESHYLKAASLFAEKVVPSGIACCGFAGDKGLHVPALSTSALESMNVEALGVRGCSASLLCEAALSRRTQAGYQSLIQVADFCFLPKPAK